MVGSFFSDEGNMFPSEHLRRNTQLCFGAEMCTESSSQALIPRAFLGSQPDVLPESFWRGSLSSEPLCKQLPRLLDPSLQPSLWCEQNCFPFCLLLFLPHRDSITLTFCVWEQVPQQELPRWLHRSLEAPRKGFGNLGPQFILVPLPWVPLVHRSYVLPAQGMFLPFDTHDLNSVQNSSKCLHHTMAGFLPPAKQPIGIDIWVEKCRVICLRAMGGSEYAGEGHMCIPTLSTFLKVPASLEGAPVFSIII